MRRSPFVVLFAFACAQPLGEEGATVETVRALVEEHVEEAGRAASVEEIGALEADYRARWASMRDGEGAGDCPMGGHMGMEMGCAEGIDEGMAHHADAHGHHGDMADCLAEEADHEAHMEQMLDEMAEHGCDGMGSGGMGSGGMGSGGMGSGGMGSGGL